MIESETNGVGSSLDDNEKASKQKADVFDINTKAKIENPEQQSYRLDDAQVAQIITDNLEQATIQANTKPEDLDRAKQVSLEPQFIANVKNAIETSSDPEHPNTQIAAVVYALNKEGLNVPPPTRKE